MIETAIKHALADALREGWNPTQIARLCDISQPNLHRYLKGEMGISLSTAEKIAKTFGMQMTNPTIPKRL